MASPFAADAPGKLKRGRASLVGGFATGLCVLALWLAFTAEFATLGGPATWVGVAASAAVAAWVRVADL